MIVVQIEAGDSEPDCLVCNWPQKRLYVTAPDDASGQQFYQQNGGLCAECFLSGCLDAGEVLEVHERGSLEELDEPP